MADEKPPSTIELCNDAVKIVVRVEDDGQVLLQDVLPAGSSIRKSGSPHFDISAAPLCEIRLAGEGNLKNKTSKAFVGSYFGTRLRYRSHQTGDDESGKTKRLDIQLHDDQSGISVTCHLVIFSGISAVRSSTTVTNHGAKDVTIIHVSSIVVGGMTRSQHWWSDYVVSYATNTWFREAQWHDRPLPEVGLDDFGMYGMPDDHHASLATFSVSNRGTFSTNGHLPLGMLKSRNDGETWLWQIENNGSWKWEIGDYKDDVYVAVGGPNANDHEWRQRLAPGASFTSATAAVTHAFGGVDEAFAALTEYRRQIRRPHPDHEAMPIIFNDYMNCLMGDPTDEKILALVGPVSKSGAEYFVIDAGWYADDTNWWDDVGAWEPSTKRFPMGFNNLLAKIREAGLKPGLWVEAEVIGIRSSIARALPDEAFFQRDGERVLEKNRYQLDFRHPAVIQRMNEVIDRLVRVNGAEYFKFDYNIEVTQGTDVNCSSAGVGQLDHNRAYLAWVEGLLDRYPGLVIENCSSGGQRMDYAMLAIHPLQSTSDQQDPVKYATIAAGIHTAVTPEQGATWAYPQPGWDDEINALTVVNSLLGRVHLSGRLDLLSPAQLELVYEGMRVYKTISGAIATAVPFWPLGLPKWHDEWLAVGLRAANPSAESSGLCYLAAWRRGGSETCDLPISAAGAGRAVSVELLYPAKFAAEAEWDATKASLRLSLAPTVCARLFQLTWN